MKTPPFWQFQSPSTDIMREIISLFNQVLFLMSLVVLIVFGLIGYISYRFSYKRNPIPTKIDSNFRLEVIWTVIPTLIIILIAVPSITLIKKINTTPTPVFTIKVTARQWFWNYQYINHDNLSFDSRMLGDEDNWDLGISNKNASTTLKENKLDPIKNANDTTFIQNVPTEDKVRLLEVDNRMVVPIGSVIRLIFTSGDVIHSFAIPSAGLKMDCIPGRLTESWLKFDQIGVYRGQCSELCGADHGFMPIVVEAVSGPDFDSWINKHKNEQA